MLSVSQPVVLNSLGPHELYPPRFLCPWNSLGKNTGVGSHFLLQELNLGLLHCRQILYHLSHQGSLLSAIPTRTSTGAVNYNLPVISFILQRFYTRLFVISSHYLCLNSCHSYIPGNDTSNTATSLSNYFASTLSVIFSCGHRPCYYQYM